MNNLLNTVGLLLSFIGSLAFAKGLFITQKDALRLGRSRYASGNDEEDLSLPQVQDRLSQRRWGIIGAMLISVGFILQLVGLFQ